jgi:quercetin 2,3-dioxygenase
MMSPRYRDITADKVPEVQIQNGVRIKIIAGNIIGKKGPMDDIVIDPQFLDCTVPAEQAFTHGVDPSYTAFIYVIGGKGATDGKAIGNGNLILYEKGDHLTVTASDKPLRFLLLTGKPLHEPVAWKGPIVMNTQEELETAFQEYKDGTFIKAE